MDHHDGDWDSSLGDLILWCFTDGDRWPTLIALLAALTLLAYHYFG